MFKKCMLLDNLLSLQTDEPANALLQTQGGMCDIGIFTLLFILRLFLAA